jgi:hypothetical protein
MSLHRDMGIQVIKSSVGLLAPVPATLVHALDFFITTTRSLVLLRARDWNERVDLLGKVANISRLTLIYHIDRHAGK